MPMSMSMGLGQLWRPDPRSLSRHEPHLILRSTHVKMDTETKRMIVYLLEKCRVKSTALFKCMKASDANADDQPNKGSISAAQFELCIRCVDITAPKAVFLT